MNNTNSSAGSFSTWLAKILTNMGFGMRAKLILLFVVIKVVPLVLLALVAWYQAVELGDEMRTRTENMAQQAVREFANAGDIAVSDAVEALDDRATEEIERMTTDTAHRISNFLYDRDNDIRILSSLPIHKSTFEIFIKDKVSRIVKQRKWKLADDGKSWVPETELKKSSDVSLLNEQNSTRFRYRPPDNFEYEFIPLYHEITYIDLNGQEKLKVTSTDLLDQNLKNVSDKNNTFCKAEDYFAKLKELKPGEIYVSDVIGEYVGTKLIGMYTPENAKKKNIPFEPEKSAYVGDENPNGKRFRGLVRWGMPVVKNDKIIGYVTMALNHDHILSSVQHLVPQSERYSDISSAAQGNYTFIWDHKGRSIAHPRHHSIAGFDPETGDPQVPFLDADTYKRWTESGESYAEFIAGEPEFKDQRREVKPAIDLLKQGFVGLDCRYLNFAPQCTGWYNLSRDGGSGSFLILWSGLWKLTTVSAIPYYTGQYGNNLRGFGIVTVTVGVDDFHRPALETQETIQQLVENTDKELSQVSEQTFDAIASNLWDTATSLSLSTIAMTVLVIFVAVLMASAITKNITKLIRGISRFSSGERSFRFDMTVKDEFGILCNSLDELFDSIEQSVKNPMVITDIDRKVIYVNSYALEVVSKTLDEVLGKNYEDISLFGKSKCPIAALIDNLDVPIHYSVAQKRYYKGSAVYLHDNTGNKIGYIISSEDITQLITEQERIERERAMLDMVLSASPDMIWYKNTEGVYLAVNPRFSAMLGISPEEIHGRSDKDLLSEHLYQNSRESDHAVLNGGIATYDEYRVSFADGHEEILDIVRTPIFNAEGVVRGILGVGRDVSLRVNAENELRQTQRELIQAVTEANNASRSKSEFLARMSHEIRTPMNAIIGMTNITKRKLSESDCTKDDLLPHVHQIESSSMHLLGLLNDILDISKIEAGKIELSEESFDMSKLVDDVASIISPRCNSKNIQFTVNASGLEHKRFISDVLRLRQVLINLLGNAVKFTPELGNITFTLEQRERKDGQTLVFFSVADTGIGIAPDKRKTLFAPFEQGGGHITRIYGGTGLGLSISRSIAMLLGSDIFVESEENKGSEFYFSLWLKEDEAYIDNADGSDSMPIMAGKRVLLVDDVDINRIIAMELLSPFDLIIEEASDGTEAVEMFSASAIGYYDLVFMDIQMPKMNGYEASKNIRLLERDDAKTTPIVAMTANAFQDDIDMAFAHGMNGHVAKPIDMEKLIDVLKSYLGGHR